MTQLTSESVLAAIPDRPASKLEPLSHCGCIWLHRLLESRCHSTAHSTRQLRRCQDRLARALAAAAAARWVPRRRCEGSSAEHIGTERRLDADATISVDVGAHSGDDWACG